LSSKTLAQARSRVFKVTLFKARLAPFFFLSLFIFFKNKEAASGYLN